MAKGRTVAKGKGHESSAASGKIQLLRTVSESFCARYRPQSQSTDWGQSLAMYGLFRANEVAPSERVKDYLRTWLTFHLAEGVPVNYFCGSWSFGLICPSAIKLFPDLAPQIVSTARRIYEFMMQTALRNGAGIMLHNIDLPNIYIDTVYYGSAILSKIGPLLNVDWEDEAVKQLILHLEVLLDGSKPFFIHCEQNNGGDRSEGSWGRGNGWVMMTLAEVIPQLPRGPRRNDLIALYHKLAESLATFQTSNGLWRTIVDDKSAYEEVSASAMYLFAYSAGKANRVFGKEYDSVIRKARRGLENAVDSKSRVTGVSEGTWPGTVEYYKSLKTGEWWWGTGAFLLAISELSDLETSL